MSEDKPRVHMGPCTHFILSRRKFLGSAAAAAISAPLLSACEFANIRDESLLEPVEPEIPFSTSDADVAGIETVGGFGCVTSGAVQVLLIRDSEEQLLAFDRYCPHQTLDMSTCEGNALPATWDEGGNRQLKCNWHGSVFDEQGKFVEGPAGVSDLKRYDVDFDPETGSGTIYLFGKPAES